MLVYVECECFVMQMLYVCVLCASYGSSQCCMTCSLLMLVEDARGDHMEEAYSSVSFCLPHPVAVSAFMICRGLCACTEMLWMCVLYVSLKSQVRPRTFGYVAMGSALLSIFSSRLAVYSTGSSVNRVQVVLSGFSMRLFCFVQTET